VLGFDNVLDFIAASDDAIIITTPEQRYHGAYGIIKIIANRDREHEPWTETHREQGKR
jgi:MinD-like ATPase involved in chromosome partitioning or flagellar assembly